VDLDRILQSIHEYFEELGMAEIRRRQVACMLPVKSAFGSLSFMMACVLWSCGYECKFTLWFWDEMHWASLFMNCI
jgi:hypothetical protein